MHDSSSFNNNKDWTTNELDPLTSIVMVKGGFGIYSQKLIGELYKKTFGPQRILIYQSGSGITWIVFDVSDLL